MTLYPVPNKNEYLFRLNMELRRQAIEQYSRKELLDSNTFYDPSYKLNLIRDITILEELPRYFYNKKIQTHLYFYKLNIPFDVALIIVQFLFGTHKCTFNKNEIISKEWAMASDELIQEILNN